MQKSHTKVMPATAPVTKTVETQAVRIAALAQAMVSSLEAPQQIQDELDGLVSECLDAGQEAALEDAVALAGNVAPDTSPAQTALQTRIARACESLAPGLLNDGKALRGTLVSVPVLLRGGLFRLYRDIEDKARFAQFVENLQDSGIFQPGASLSIVPYLYHPEELADLPWCERRSLLKTIFNERNALDAVPPDLLLKRRVDATGLTEDEASDGGLCLRYLVGVLAENVSEEEAELPPPSFLENSDAFREVAKTGIVHFAAALGLPEQNKPYGLGKPTAFLRGYLAGMVLFKTASFKLELASALSSTSEKPAQLQALVVPCRAENGDLTLRVSLASSEDSSLVAGCGYPVSEFEEASDVVQRIGATMHAAGITRAQLVEEEQLDLTCESCGSAAYYIAARDGGSELEVEHVHRAPRIVH